MNGQRLPAELRTGLDDSARTRAHTAFVLLATCVAALSIAPSGLNFLLLPHVSSNVADTVVRSQQASLLSRALVLTAVAIALWAVLRRGSVLVRAPVELVAVLALPVYFLASALARGSASLDDLLATVAVVAILTAVWSLRLGRDAIRILGTVGVATAAYSLFLGAAFPSKAFFGGVDSLGYSVASAKAIVGSSLLAGPFGHSNTLGAYMALSIPLAMLAWRGRARWVALTVLGFALAWSGSRTSMVAAGCALIVMAVVAFHGRRSRPAISGMILWACGAAAVATPFLVHERTAFTRRGAIWYESVEAWSRQPLAGQGLKWYAEVGSVTNNLGEQASSGHNVVLTWLVTGGLLAAVLGLWAWVRLSTHAAAAARNGLLAPLGYAVALAVVATLETIWVANPSSELFFITMFATTTILRVVSLEGDSVIMPTHGTELRDEARYR